MRNLIRLVGLILLSIPWFPVWPIVLWQWSVRAHHVPHAERQEIFSWCLAGTGILLIYAVIMAMGGSFTQLIAGVAAYTGAGIAALITGITLSRKYRPKLQITASNSPDTS